ncbi:MAG: SPOUT family RNA methylase [Desulfurococcales archaeon]|nr:SPOUT family RNA methylase [Desulfurococcales archaeon]
MIPCIIAKTPLGMEKTAAARIKEIKPYIKVEPSPKGYQGLLLVYDCKKKDMEIEEFSREIPEIERAYIVQAAAPADPGKIAEAAVKIIQGKIDENKCFAVKTVRRGKHAFTSIDVNAVVGAVIKERTGACVNLTKPDIIVGIEIIEENAYITTYPGSFVYRKYEDKKMLYSYTRKISVIQMPYLAEPSVSYKMGVRVGREVQNFEIKELIIAPIGLIDGLPLAKFIEGVEEGIESRYKIQKKSYSRIPHRVRVKMQDLYQVVRSRRDEPLIVLEPEGNYITHEKAYICKIFSNSKRINILAGSREGIPIGIYRIANRVLDIAPGITLSTEFAVVSGLIAIMTTIYDWVEDIE